MGHGPRNPPGIVYHVMDPPFKFDPAFLGCRTIVGIRQIDFHKLGTSRLQAQVIVVFGFSPFHHSAFVWNVHSVARHFEYVIFDTFQRRVPFKDPKIIHREIFKAEA
jgi:hypothetical protein